MSSRWRYYNKRGANGFRGRGRGRGRGTSLTAISLPREDHLHNDKNNEYYRDKAMDPKDFRDETVLSISFGQNMLGAAYYEQSGQIIKIMNDISEDHEFEYLKRLINEVKPTMILVNKSQDLNFIKFLSSKYEAREKISEGNTTDETMESIPQWDASLAYSTDTTTMQQDKDDDDEESSAPSAKLFKLSNNFFKMLKALERLKRMVGTDDPTMTDENKYMIVAMRFDVEAVNMIRSLGALLLFLDDTRMGVESEPLSVSSPIKSIKTLTLPNLVEIDYNTIQALDILPKETDKKKSAGQQKSLYSLMDMCRSTVGKKCLQKWFRNPTSDRDELVSRQKCVHFFKQDWNAEVTAKIASMLGRVKPLNNIFSRFQSGTAQLIHWEGFISTVNAMVEIVGIIRDTPISNELIVEADLLREVSEIAVITGSIINFTESRMLGRLTIMPGIDAELDRMKDIYENMPMMLTAIARQEGAKLGLPNVTDVSCLYVPLIGFILSLPTDYPIGSQPDMALVYATSEELRVTNSTTERLENEFGDVLMKLIDCQTAIILSLKTRVLQKKRYINTLLAMAARIDALVSLGLVAAENGWNCPALIDEPVIEAAELFHPISAMVVKKQFVPNQVSSGRKGVKVSIITGPNACGKSVYMKSIGILAFLTHIGSFVPARHAKVGTVDRIVTRMFTVDSVLDGMSTFAKDVEQVALALRRATANSLVIIDEFGKGTMTEVGLSLLASCMNHWMLKGPEKCPHVFLSSHFHALPRYIPLQTNMATFLTFTVLREPGGKVKYLFQLTQGMVDCSFAMAVAKEEGIPMPVIGRACRIYKALKSGTPLRKIRAEVDNNDEKLMVADMDFVLENGETLIDSVESFLKRDQERREEVERQARQADADSVKRADSSEQRDKQPPKTAPVVEPEEKPKEKPTDSRPKPSSKPVSSKSLIYKDPMAVFDALMPLREKKKVEKPKEPEPTRVLSPDIFTTDGEEEEELPNKTLQITPSKLIPLMQRLSSDEERDKIRGKSRSLSATSSKVIEAVPEKKIPDERTGIKRPHSSSIREGSVDPKRKEQTLEKERSKTASQDSMFKTPIQKGRTSDSSFKSKSSQGNFDDSMFKTPTNIARPQKSSAQRRSSQMSTSQERIEVGSKKTHSSDLNDTRRSSSRREMRREDDEMTQRNESPEWNFFSPLGSEFPLFDTQQSAFEMEPKDSSSRSEPRSTGNHSFVSSGEKGKDDRSKALKNVDEFVFETPKTKVSEKQKSFLLRKTQLSRQSVSPSSVILGNLSRGSEERTPLPRGDKPERFDFEFNPDDDDPVYGKNGPTNSLIFDFLQSDDEDDDFLRSLMESQKSSSSDSAKR